MMIQRRQGRGMAKKSHKKTRREKDQRAPQFGDFQRKAVALIMTAA